MISIVNLNNGVYPHECADAPDQRSHFTFELVACYISIKILCPLIRYIANISANINH